MKRTLKNNISRKKQLPIISQLEEAGLESRSDIQALLDTLCSSLGNEFSYPELLTNLNMRRPIWSYYKDKNTFYGWQRGVGFFAEFFALEDRPLADGCDIDNIDTWQYRDPLPGEIAIGLVTVKGVGTKRYRTKTTTDLSGQKVVFRDRVFRVTEITIMFDKWSDCLAETGIHYKLSAIINESGETRLELEKMAL
jgi:hypothetical protein